MKRLLFLILTLGVLAVVESQAQNFTHSVPSRSVLAHRNVQHHNSYPEWRRRQPRIRRQAARAVVKQHKRVVRALKKVERILRFEDRSRSRINRTH